MTFTRNKQACDEKLMLYRKVCVHTKVQRPEVSFVKMTLHFCNFIKYFQLL